MTSLRKTSSKNSIDEGTASAIEETAYPDDMSEEPSTKTVDVQTDTPNADKNCSSWLMPSTFPSSTTRAVLSTERIAQYIEDKMREQYMEQTRTLEQLQQQMKQQLIEKQAQLLEQLKTLDTHQLVNGGTSTDPDDLDSSLIHSKQSNKIPTNDNSNTNTTGTSTGPGLRADQLPTPGSSSSTHALTNNKDHLSNSLSADESVNSNVSQASSHDTWDSSNVFTHERPVLTGSERSTPTPLLPTVDDSELISQSIHIPCQDDPVTLKQPNDNLVELNTADDIPAGSHDLLASKVSRDDLLMDDFPTPRNQLENGVKRELNLVDTKAAHMTSEETSCDKQIEAESSWPLIASSSSTPPPESPGDDLSASLRLSLRQKHSRHLADLKAYYEKELTELKERLTSPEAISQHESYRNLEIENRKLQERCRVLEQELLRANRYIDDVDDQMNQLERSFNASLNQNQSANHHISDLSQNDIETYKVRVKTAESQISSLESRNKELFSALLDAYEVRDNTALTASQENKKYQELQEQYNHLRIENNLISNKLKSTDHCLAEALKEVDILKQTVQSLQSQASHQKSSPHASSLSTRSFSKFEEVADKATRSPLLKAEQQHLSNRSSTPLSQKCTQSSNNMYSLDKSKSKQNFTPLSNDHSSSQLQTSDTQSSESSIEHHKHRPHYKSNSRRLADKHTEQINNNHSYTVCKDDLVSAYSPIVDRQRHSSSASSNGPVRKTTSSSPHRQSQERPFGFHHVGACISPSKRTQQWAILSPFNCNADPHEKARLPAQSSAKKSLDFSPQPKPTTSPSHTKKSTQTENITTVTDKQMVSPSKKPSTPTAKAKAKVKEDRLQLIKDAEIRLDELLMEKRQLESSLTRMSTSHNRNDRLKQESLERQLDRIDKDLGSVRMTLRRYNAL